MSSVIASPPLLAASIIEVRPGVVLWTAITFLIVMLLLSKIAWGPMIQMLDLRDHVIREALEHARKDRVAAERLLAERKATLTMAYREAAKLRQEVLRDVEELRADLTANARKQAADLILQAREQISDQKTTAFGELKRRIPDLAVEAERRMIGSVNSHFRTTRSARRGR